MRPSRDAGSAPPLRSEEVPSELMCSICFGIPLRPAMVTPCEHVFCEGCIEQALTGMSSCPNCRMDCSPTHIRGLVPRSLPYRVWSGIAVKCPKHESGCGWTGSAIDAVGHMEVCTADKRNGRSGSSCLECDSIREENRELSKKVTELETRLAQSEQTLRTLRRDVRLQLPILFTGHYCYDRDDVVELSQLISRYLENPPDNIDKNRIYNCVKNCYDDLKRYNDNPKHYKNDMRMLLSTCRATAGWFSDKQMDNIEGWMKEQGWFG